MRPREYIVSALARYWSDAPDILNELSVPDRMEQGLHASAAWLHPVPLPEWAQDLAPDARIPLPEEFIAPGDDPTWQRTDWLGGAFWFLHCQAERNHENHSGSIHSVSSKLHDFDPVMWERCWVNRIALFLRRWAARQANTYEENLGQLPPAEIVLTCDIDALDKTMAVRLKQTIFRLQGALKATRQGFVKPALSRFGHALRFAFKKGEYDNFAFMARTSASLELRKICHLFAGQHNRPLIHKLLLDPTYELNDPRILHIMTSCQNNDWEVGLHPSFGSADNTLTTSREKQALESLMNVSVNACRQHWLRFSFAQTWKAQQKAGLTEDFTLGFNDRHGFRNGAALRFHPWDDTVDAPLSIAAQPLVFMDSQLFTDPSMDQDDRRQVLSSLIREIREVRGQASLLWHPHTLSQDFDWTNEFTFLMDLLHNEEP